MGAGPFRFSYSKFDKSNDDQMPGMVGGFAVPGTPSSSNPNPSNYEILDSRQIGPYLIVKIKYPDCTNYEGIKILVFKGCTLGTLQLQKLIDPHFSENKEFHSPIARFEPTDAGWDMALNLCCDNLTRLRNPIAGIQIIP